MSPVCFRLSVRLCEICPLNVAAGEVTNGHGSSTWGWGQGRGEGLSRTGSYFPCPTGYTSLSSCRCVWGGGQPTQGQELGLWGGVLSVTVEGRGPRYHQADLGSSPWGWSGWYWLTAVPQVHVRGGHGCLTLARWVLTPPEVADASGRPFVLTYFPSWVCEVRLSSPGSGPGPGPICGPPCGPPCDSGQVTWLELGFLLSNADSFGYVMRLMGGSRDPGPPPAPVLVCVSPPHTVTAPRNFSCSELPPDPHPVSQQTLGSLLGCRGAAPSTSQLPTKLHVPVESGPLPAPPCSLFSAIKLLLREKPAFAGPFCFDMTLVQGRMSGPDRPEAPLQPLRPPFRLL